MPIITGTVVEPPPAEVPPPAQLPGVGFASATYYAPDGSVWPLTDTSDDRGYFTLSEGVSGLGAAPVEFTTDAHPRGGARIRHIQPQPRDIVWPLHVFGPDHDGFVERWEALAKALTATHESGPGILEIARPNGRRRRIHVHYREGFEGQPDQGYGIISDSAVITWFCEDPFWYDPTAITVHREHSVGVPFLNPFPTISSGQVLGATTVHNPGHIEVWPEWTITGPASLVTFTHTGTGESFALDPNNPKIAHGNLLAGEQVTVATNPMRVRYQNGDNWTGAINFPGATLWPLQPGDNAVTFALSGAGPGSAVDLAFNPRYQTA